MTFSKLTAGEYVYKITASDQYNTNLVLLEEKFTVNALEQPEEDYEGIKWNVIDLSYHNEIQSWDEIADSVDAVILRIGYRSTGTKKIGADRDFKENYQKAKEQGLPVGCYFFSAAVTVEQAVEEAEYVLKILKENNCTMEMPVYFDIETDEQLALSTQAATNLARAFCEKIEEGGYYTGIYCNKFFARDQLYAHQLADFHFWIAQYASKCTYDGPYGMWQYSETGSVPGLKGNVDLDYCYYNYPQIIKNLGMSGYEKEEIKPTAKPSFEFKKIDNFAFNSDNTIIYGIESKMTTQEFTEKYIELKDGATVNYTTTVGGCVATGTKVQLIGDGKILAEYVISVNRDTDMNSVINSSDALLVLQHAVGTKSLGPARRLSADSTGDGKINSSDALEILTYVVSGAKAMQVD
jgi:GH25 family lysozyme M1 (1,4-beta-N-acetylmuramidase)